MMPTHNSQSTNSQIHWAPARWDLLAGGSTVEDEVARKANVRGKISPIELGTNAGRAVLDQYYAAKGDTSLGATIRATLSFQNATNVAAMTLPIVGLAAAIGVDYAVFGSAAKDLVTTTAPQILQPQATGLLGYFSNFHFNAFAFGSLIFASGLGLAEKSLNTVKKTFFYGTLFIASAGASFIAANNDKFRDHFSATIKSAFTAGSDPKQAEVDGLKLQISAKQDEIDDSYNIYCKGTYDKHKTNRKPGEKMCPIDMESDGNKGNDETAKEIIRTINSLKLEKSKLTDSLSKATPELDQAKRKDWADFAGRLLATSYIAAWLIASQLLIAEIVRRSSENYKNLSDKLTQRSKEKKFAKDIEHFDDAIRDPIIRSFVEVVLSRFSEKLSLSKEDPKNPDKLTNFGALFEEPNYTQMVDAGVRVVKGAVTPRSPTIWEHIQSMARGFNKKAKAEGNDNGSNSHLGQSNATAEAQAPPTEERKPV